MIFSIASILSKSNTWKMALNARNRPAASAAPVLGHLPHHQRAGADQRFLVGEADQGAAADGGQRRLEPGGADDRRHDPVRPDALRGFDDGGTAGGRRRCRCRRGRPSACRNVLVADRDEARLQPQRLLDQQIDIAMGGQRLDPVGARDCARSTSMVLQPTEPVEPRMVTQRGPSIRARGVRSFAQPLPRSQPCQHTTFANQIVQCRPPRPTTASRPSTRSRTPP